MLTKTQIKKIQKAARNGTGADIKISKAQMAKVGGSIWSSVASLAGRFLPKVLPMAKSLLSPLATGALTGVGENIVNKLFGKGQTCGFIIPPNTINQLLLYIAIMTIKQKRDLNKAMQTGQGMRFLPTKHQMGTGLWSILASSGIPLAVNLISKLTGKGLKVDRSKSRRSRPVYVPPNIDGGLVYPMMPPPVYGMWPTTGRRKKRTRITSMLGIPQNTGFNSNVWSNIPLVGQLI